MSDVNAKIIVSPKVLKTKKPITSKIDSGIAKKPSTLTIVTSRQSSQPSRSASKQSTNIVAGKPANTPSKNRPATSISSTRFSSSTKLCKTDDNLHRSFHKPGQIPNYLHKKRPTTVSGALKIMDSEPSGIQPKNVEGCQSAQKMLQLASMQYQKFQTNVGAQFNRYTKSKDAMDGIAKKSTDKSGECKAEPNLAGKAPDTNLEQEVARVCVETDQIDSGVQVGAGPPCEGLENDTMQTAALLEMGNKMRQLEEIYKQQEVEVKCQRVQVLKLEENVKAKLAVIKEREEDIEKLQNCIENLRTIAASRDTISHDGLHDLEKKLSELRAELAQKCNELNRSTSKTSTLSTRVDELKKQLAKAGSDLEEKENRIFELIEKKTEKDSAIEALLAEKRLLDQRNQETNLIVESLQQDVATLTQQIAQRDAQIVNLEASGTVQLAKTELLGSPKAHQDELEALQAEVKQLRYENSMLVNVKKQDDILLQIRSKLLDNLSSSKEAFKAQCDELCRLESGEEEIGGGRQGFEMLFNTLAEKQRRCCKEEQIIGEIDQNNQKCKAVRSKLLDMLKQLKKENREMRSIISRSNCGPDQLTEHYEEPKRDDSQLKGQLLTQICRLFPDEVPAQVLEEDCNDEQITSRITYDEKIGGE